MSSKYSEIIKALNNTPRNTNESILIIDGLNVLIRNLSIVNQINYAGDYIGGITGTLKSIGYVTRIFNPTKVIVVFDGEGSSSNKRNLYPNYKSNRNKNRLINYKMFSTKEEENESIFNQTSRLIQYLKCLPISLISIDGLEADDVVGYLSTQYELIPSTKEVTLVSADQDYLQLVSNKIKVYSPSKKKIYKPEDILKEYNVLSENFILYKILLGDTSDNLPGINGLGPKKIAKLYPELSEKIMGFDYIKRNALNNQSKNILYEKVLQNENQLIINNKLMNLKENIISNENKQLINELNNTKYEYNPTLFYQMYQSDIMGNAIPNLSGWLNQTFFYLK